MSASPSILTTKLYIPPLRPAVQLVTRPRLTARLREGLTRPLTLISAPAGFGKTTLVGEWRASLVDAEEGYSLIWSRSRQAD